METIVISNQKGGVAKTVTAAAMASGLARRGFRVLGLDVDPQHSFTKICGIKRGLHTLADVIDRRIKPAAAITETDRGFDFLPGDSNLANLPESYNLDTLRGILAELAPRYDYCVIDTPTALTLNTMSALVAASAVVVPTEPDALSLDGVEQLAETIDAIRSHNDLKNVKILITRYNGRFRVEKLLKDTAPDVGRRLGVGVYDQAIRSGTAIRQACLVGQDFYEYDPRSGAVQDYESFIDEFLRG